MSPNELVKVMIECDELEEQLKKVTRERDIWRAVCCVGLAAIFVLNYLGW